LTPRSPWRWFRCLIRRIAAVAINFLASNEDRAEDRTPITEEALIQQAHDTLDELRRDGATRGDIKLITTALKELRYCFNVFSRFRTSRKITVFGSARLPSADLAYQAAVRFGRKMAEADFMVITGAAAGIMEAGHVGSGRDKAIGINILLPFEQQANSVIDGDTKLMHLKYFFMRKLLFVKESDAVACFPGGFGTQDETFEVLTLVQTGKSHLFPIVLLDEPGGDYWKCWQDYITDQLLARELISVEDLSLYKVTSDVDEAVEEVLTFYRVYHSMRYVGRDLVFRLHKRLPESVLEFIRTNFSDLLVAGTFEQGGPMPAEGAEFPELARLRFYFNRHNMGRLRQLIDTINREGSTRRWVNRCHWRFRRIGSLTHPGRHLRSQFRRVFRVPAWRDTDIGRPNKRLIAAHSPTSLPSTQWPTHWRKNPSTNAPKAHHHIPTARNATVTG
jgi:uncharacterized protein (TIGR00730 family)